jgi:hypothetical protein
MKFFAVLGLLAALAAAFPRDGAHLLKRLTPDNDKCSADNCARAVTGTRMGKRPDITSRAADCSSFMLATVTPAPTYVIPSLFFVLLLCNDLSYAIRDLRWNLSMIQANCHSFSTAPPL